MLSFCFFFHVSRPNTGTSPFEEEKSNLLNKYISICSEDAGTCLSCSKLDTNIVVIFSTFIFESLQFIV